MPAHAPAKEEHSTHIAAGSSIVDLATEVDEEINATPVPWMHGAAGIAGGSISMSLFYPLDFLRTRMHTYDGSSASQLRTVQQIVKQEGVKGMYRGVGVAVAAHSIGWGMYLTLFRWAQGNFAAIRGCDSSLGDFLGACCAAFTTATLVTPLNLLKTRTQLGDRPAAERNADGSAVKKKKLGIVGKLRFIAAEEGWKSLFRGVGPQILLSSHTTIQVALYEFIKRQYWGSEPAPVYGVAMASAASKSVACVICNPLEVARTRLQDKRNLQRGDEYSSMRAAFRTIWQKEGMRGLYRGVGVNVCRVVPTTVVAFVMYEEILKVIQIVAK